MNKHMDWSCIFKSSDVVYLKFWILPEIFKFCRDVVDEAPFFRRHTGAVTTSLTNAETSSEETGSSTGSPKASPPRTDI